LLNCITENIQASEGRMRSAGLMLVSPFQYHEPPNVYGKGPHRLLWDVSLATLGKI